MRMPSQQPALGQVKLHLNIEIVSGILLALPLCALPWVANQPREISVLLLLCLSLTFAVLTAARKQAVEELSFLSGCILFPMIGLAVIGLLQLLPVWGSYLAEMERAPFSQHRFKLDPYVKDSLLRTCCASLTRTEVAKWLALSLLLWSAAASYPVLKVFRIVLGALTLNAAVLAAVGIHQRVLTASGPDSHLSSSLSFGPFANPNNAASYLCLHIAISLANLRLTPFLPTLNLVAGRRSVKFQTLLFNFRSVMATLSVHFLVNVGCVLLIAAGIIATLSRGGILCLLVVFLLLSVPMARKVPGVVKLALAGCGLLALLGLVWSLGMSKLMLQELATLADPTAAFSIRFHHWKDVTCCVRDFPLSGMGGGTYRLATLPYQAFDHVFRFTHADNQYVEFAVEFGLPGLFLFILLGLGTFQLAVSTIFQQMGPSPILKVKTLAEAVLGIVISTAVLSLMDFSTALPSLCAVSATLAGFLIASRRFAVRQQKRSRKRLTKLIRVSLIVSTVIFLPDSIAAARIAYNTRLADERIAAPILPDPAEEARLLQALKNCLLYRGDDFYGRSCISRISELRWRRQLFEAILSERPTLSAKWDSHAYDSLSPTMLVLSLCHLHTNSFQESVRVNSRLQELLREWRGHAELTMPSECAVICPDNYFVYLMLRIIAHDQSPSQDEARTMLFLAPNDQSKSFVLGLVARQRSRASLSDECWRTQTHLTLQQRQVMIENCSELSPGEVVRKYAPDDYNDTVALCGAILAGELKLALLFRAEEQWNALGPNPSPQQITNRLKQLRMEKRTDEIIPLLELLTATSSDTGKILVLLAQHLESIEAFRRSRAVWTRVLDNAEHRLEAEKAIIRLDRRIQRAGLPQ